MERLKKPSGAAMHTPQSPTSFPSQNKKHIDYVITYKDHTDDNQEKRAKKVKERKIFFEKLQEEEGLEVEILEFGTGEELHNYALIHCPLERLMVEAEKIKLNMKLNDTFLKNDDEDEIIELNLLQRFAKAIRLDKVFRREQSDTVSAKFEKSLSFIFDGFQEGEEPFRNTIRSLLVENILNNLVINKDKQKKSISGTSSQPNQSDIVRKTLEAKQVVKTLKSENGLAYMLHEKYFDDALILHDQTNHYIYLQEMLKYYGKLEEGDDGIFPKIRSDEKETDARKQLHLKWALPKNILKFQPLSLIRGYFGELFTLYFAWLGTFTFTLIFPTIIGIIFFIVGISNSASNYNSNNNATSSTYGNYYLNLFADSFDNYLTPVFALIISLWGAIFSEYWTRENNRLAFEWDVLDFERDENDLPEYTRRQKLKKLKQKDKGEFVKYIYNQERYFKIFLSGLILMFMTCVVAMDVAAVVLYRIHIKTKTFPNDKVLQVVVGDIGSTILNTIFIQILNAVYNKIALWSTKWENYRTKTKYDDALILKLFAFQFVNSYSSLFYMAFFRQINYENGIFNLGPDYQDKCDNDNCMALLSIQVLVVLLLKPLPSYLTTVIWPFIHLYIKRLKIKKQTEKIGQEDRNDEENEKDNIKKLNRKIVSVHIAVEKQKTNPESTINAEYTEKIILYGYVSLFACSFFLGPLILLFINIIDIRIDAFRLIWLFRRPVGYRAQDIGSWFYIMRFLNIASIISNAFLIAFTSNWSKTFLENKLEYKFVFVVAFEHVVFIIWFLIILILPGMPRSIKAKIKSEAKQVKEILLAAKIVKNNPDQHDAKELAKLMSATKSDSETQENIPNEFEKNSINDKMTRNVDSARYSKLDNENDEELNAKIARKRRKRVYKNNDEIESHPKDFDKLSQIDSKPMSPNTTENVNIYNETHQRNKKKKSYKFLNLKAKIIPILN